MRDIWFIFCDETRTLQIELEWELSIIEALVTDVAGGVRDPYIPWIPN